MKKPTERSSTWGNYFWSITSSVSVRTKILGIALSMVFLLGAMAILVVRTSMQRVVTKELELSAASIAENLATRSIDAILVNNYYLLYQLMSETKINHPDIRYIFVVSSSGRILVHTFGAGFPPGLLTANGAPNGGPSRVLVLNTTEGLIWDVATPILGGRVGTIRMGFSDALFVRTVNAVTVQLLMATLLVSTVSILLAIFLTWILTRPIQQLARAAHAVGQGDLNQQVARWANDEIGELADSFNNMVTNLRLAAEARQESDRLRAELVERVINAQEQERKRIACDLHDQTSQALVSLIVQVKLVESAPNTAARNKNLDILRDQLRTTLGEVRQMALDLRPNVLDDLGLDQAVRWFADRCAQNNGLAVTVVSQGDLSSLPERVAITIYRVVQESLSNIVKHSGASQAHVEVDRQADYLFIRITDNGKGFAADQTVPTGSSLGIFGMQERTTLLGGQFELQSEPGKGTVIYVKIPIAAAQTGTSSTEVKTEAER